MIFVGDYFAFGLVIVLFMFFFEGKHRKNKAGKYFTWALVMTAVNAGLDVATVELLGVPSAPLWLHMAVNSLYYLTNILTTSCIGLYLFTKILEHSHDKHCMKNAKIGLAVLLSIYTACIILNIWTGWLFYFNEQMEYCRGPLNVFGYMITICQMGLVVVCYFRNRKNASRIMLRALVQTFPVVVLCIVIQRMYPEIMLNSFIMSMVETVLFLNFQGQRQGVHSLTKLNDRHRFFESVEYRISVKDVFQVFLINIKNYSVINQKYGHVYGDEVLYQFAFSLEKLIKYSEAFHMNGTVFALLVPNQRQHTAERNADELLEFLEAGVECANEHVRLDYVMVDYVVNEGERSAEEFYEKLEYAAMQAYKQKSRYVHYEPEMGDEMQRRRYLIERLQTVDREHGFRVWYQPIFDLREGGFGSMEALIRLVEPDGSIISPAEFIPVAEQTGMISSVTWFVLEEVCRLLKEHPELKVSIGVNLPMAQLLDRAFSVRLDGMVRQYDIDRSKIGLEFTERAILENFEQIRHVMAALTDQGYCFYLDDFGSGYSNFNCLLQLPFQNIKLDAGLVKMDLSETGEGEEGLICRLADFLHGRNLQIIAEGVETEEEAVRLSQFGVDRIQGYVYARPMPEEDMLKLVCRA